MMEAALEVQGSTDDYEIVVINNNLQCSCQGYQSWGLCRHITALFTGDFSAVINWEAIEKIEPILARHPALKEFKLLNKLLKEKLEIEEEIKSLKKHLARKLNANQ